MGAQFLMLLAALDATAQQQLPPGTQITEQAGVRIQTSVRASIYTYTITNIGCEPITRFQIPYSDGYYFKPPHGWQHDDANHVFNAWTDNPLHAIRLGTSATFSFRVTSRGALLGYVDARVRSNDGSEHTINNVWGAVHEPPAQPLAIAATLIAIILFHTWHTNRTATPHAQAQVAD